MAPAAAYAEVIPGVRGIVDIYGPTDFDLTRDAATRPRVSTTARTSKFPRRQRGNGPRRLPNASGAMLVTPRAADLDLPRRAGHQRVPGAGGGPGRNLAAAGVPHALVSLPWAGHAFDLVHFNTPGAI